MYISRYYQIIFLSLRWLFHCLCLFRVIGKDGKSAPVRLTDVPQEVKDAVEAKDMDKAYALLIAESAR